MGGGQTVDRQAPDLSKEALTIQRPSGEKVTCTPHKATRCSQRAGKALGRRIAGRQAKHKQAEQVCPSVAAATPQRPWANCTACLLSCLVDELHVSGHARQGLLLRGRLPQEEREVVAACRPVEVGRGATGIQAGRQAGRHTWDGMQSCWRHEKRTG